MIFLFLKIMVSELLWAVRQQTYELLGTFVYRENEDEHP
jgi:hypothetical protein